MYKYNMKKNFNDQEMKDKHEDLESRRAYSKK